MPPKSEPERRPPKTRRVSIPDAVSGVLLLVSATLPSSDGGNLVASARAGGILGGGGALGRVQNVAMNAKDVFVSGDPYWAPTRTALAGSIGVQLIKEGVRFIAPRLSRKSFKLGTLRIHWAG